MERDPVCGMAVDPDDAEDSSTYQGNTYYFCSSDCKRKFDQGPSQYISRPQQPSAP